MFDNSPGWSLRHLTINLPNIKMHNDFYFAQICQYLIYSLMYSNLVPTLMYSNLVPTLKAYSKNSKFDIIADYYWY